MGTTSNLVLGGSGTIGSSLCKHLLSKNEKVINLDMKDGYDLRTLSLEEYANVDYVWFLAWEVGGAKYLTNENNLLNIVRNNTILCERVFSFLEKSKRPFMFASSQLAAPGTPYGVTKLLGEEWTRLLGGQIVRFWNVYGWEEPGERSHVIPDLIMQALTKKKIELMTDGQEERQFIYIDDCVENMHAIRTSGKSKVDVTNGNWITIKEIAIQIGKILDVEVIPGKTAGYSYKVNPDFLSNDLKFKTSLEDGIKILVTECKEYLSKKSLVK
jgi:nucleoside-diphosphate-sugar epimerase